MSQPPQQQVFLSGGAAGSQGLHDDDDDSFFLQQYATLLFGKHHRRATKFDDTEEEEKENDALSSRRRSIRDGRNGRGEEEDDDDSTGRRQQQGEGGPHQQQQHQSSPPPHRYHYKRRYRSHYQVHLNPTPPTPTPSTSLSTTNASAPTTTTLVGQEHQQRRELRTDLTSAQLDAWSAPNAAEGIVRQALLELHLLPPFSPATIMANKTGALASSAASSSSFAAHSHHQEAMEVVPTMDFLSSAEQLELRYVLPQQRMKKSIEHTLKSEVHYHGTRLAPGVTDMLDACDALDGVHEEAQYTRQLLVESRRSAQQGIRILALQRRVDHLKALRSALDEIDTWRLKKEAILHALYQEKHFAKAAVMLGAKMYSESGSPLLSLAERQRQTLRSMQEQQQQEREEEEKEEANRRSAAVVSGIAAGGGGSATTTTSSSAAVAAESAGTAAAPAAVRRVRSATITHRPSMLGAPTTIRTQQQSNNLSSTTTPSAAAAETAEELLQRGLRALRKDYIDGIGGICSTTSIGRVAVGQFFDLKQNGTDLVVTALRRDLASLLLSTIKKRDSASGAAASLFDPRRLYRILEGLDALRVRNDSISRFVLDIVEPLMSRAMFTGLSDIIGEEAGSTWEDLLDTLVASELHDCTVSVAANIVQLVRGGMLLQQMCREIVACADANQLQQEDEEEEEEIEIEEEVEESEEDDDEPLRRESLAGKFLEAAAEHQKRAVVGDDDDELIMTEDVVLPPPPAASAELPSPKKKKMKKVTVKKMIKKKKENRRSSSPSIEDGGRNPHGSSTTTLPTWLKDKTSEQIASLGKSCRFLTSIGVSTAHKGLAALVSFASRAPLAHVPLADALHVHSLLAKVTDVCAPQCPDGAASSTRASLRFLAQRLLRDVFFEQSADAVHKVLLNETFAPFPVSVDDMPNLYPFVPRVYDPSEWALLTQFMVLPERLLPLPGGPQNNNKDSSSSSSSPTKRHPLSLYAEYQDEGEGDDDDGRMQLPTLAPNPFANSSRAVLVLNPAVPAGASPLQLFDTHPLFTFSSFMACKSMFDLALGVQQYPEAAADLMDAASQLCASYVWFIVTHFVAATDSVPLDAEQQLPSALRSHARHVHETAMRHGLGAGYPKYPNAMCHSWKARSGLSSQLFAAQERITAMVSVTSCVTSHRLVVCALTPLISPDALPEIATITESLAAVAKYCLTVGLRRVAVSLLPPETVAAQFEKIRWDSSSSSSSELEATVHTTITKGIVDMVTSLHRKLLAMHLHGENEEDDNNMMTAMRSSSSRGGARNASPLRAVHRLAEHLVLNAVLGAVEGVSRIKKWSDMGRRLLCSAVHEAFTTLHVLHPTLSATLLQLPNLYTRAMTGPISEAFDFLATNHVYYTMKQLSAIGEKEGFVKRREVDSFIQKLNHEDRVPLHLLSD